MADPRTRLRRAGFRLRRVPSGLVNRAFERRYGIDTRGTIPLRELGLSNEERSFYVGVDWLTLLRALRALRPTGHDVFADLGAGKGRALVAASRFPFKRVIGVELSPQLAAVAEVNAAASRPRARSGPLEVVNADATTYPVPDDLTVAFLYNPFQGAVFERVMENLFASWDRAPRALRILYAYPYEHNRLLRSGRVRPVGVVRRPWLLGRGEEADVAVTYAVDAPGAVDVGSLGTGADRRLGVWARPNDVRFSVVDDL